MKLRAYEFNWTFLRISQNERIRAWESVDQTPNLSVNLQRIAF